MASSETDSHLADSCDKAASLRSLECGRLSDSDAENLWSHVQGCDVCQETLVRIREKNLEGRVLRRAVRGGDETSDQKAPTGSSGSGGKESNGVGAGSDYAGSDCADKSSWDIADYERVRLCGEGAFGTVWAVRDRVGVFRALKVIDLSRLAVARVKCRELTALEAYCKHVVAHPNLIKVSHVGMQGDRLYYTMELADDATLRRPVRQSLSTGYRPLTLQEVMQGQPISSGTAIEIILRLLRGLANLHNVGLAHRDIKPANIVFVNGQPKLSDIGMITSTDSTPSHVGTPEYMPPDKKMNFTADTYAISRVLYELLVGGECGAFPKLPERMCVGDGSWDMVRVSYVIEQGGAPVADIRYHSADRMREALESCRQWSFHDLLSELDAGEKTLPSRGWGVWAPVIAAIIQVLPWVFALILAILLVQKLL